MVTGSQIFVGLLVGWLNWIAFDYLLGLPGWIVFDYLLGLLVG